MLAQEVLLVFLLLWEYLPGWLGVPQFVLPPLSQVVVEAQRIWGTENLLWHAGITALAKAGKLDAITKNYPQLVGKMTLPTGN